MAKKIIENVGRKKDDATQMCVTSFFGGVNDGKMLQFTIGGSYAQLRHKEVVELTMELLKWLEEYSKEKVEFYKNRQDAAAVYLAALSENIMKIHKILNDLELFHSTFYLVD